MCSISDVSELASQEITNKSDTDESNAYEGFELEIYSVTMVGWGIYLKQLNVNNCR